MYIRTPSQARPHRKGCRIPLPPSFLTKSLATTQALWRLLSSPSPTPTNAHRVLLHASSRPDARTPFLFFFCGCQATQGEMECDHRYELLPPTTAERRGGSAGCPWGEEGGELRRQHHHREEEAPTTARTPLSPRTWQQQRQWTQGRQCCPMFF